jgi:hypothetical protein
MHLFILWGMKSANQGEETSQYSDGSTSTGGYISLFPDLLCQFSITAQRIKSPIYPLALFTYVTVATPSALNNGRAGPETGSPA